MKNYTHLFGYLLLALMFQTHLAEASHSPMPKLDYGVPFVELFPSEGANVPYLVPRGAVESLYGTLRASRAVNDSTSTSTSNGALLSGLDTTLGDPAAPGMSLVPEPVSLVGLIAGLTLFLGWAHRRLRVA